MRLCFRVMHLARLWIGLGLIAACAAPAAVIYKWTDADGVVHYSDQAVPGAEKITSTLELAKSAANSASRSWLPSAHR